MSQRTRNIDKEITIDLSFKVILKSFSNHDGFSEKQIENAIEEFKEKIQKELEYKVEEVQEKKGFWKKVFGEKKK